MQDPYKTTIEVYNRLGKNYLKGISKAFPKERTAFIKLFPKNARILDVGCAGGRDSRAFLKSGFRLTGIDLSRVFINAAKKYAPEGKFLLMDARKLKFPRNSFDGIWANAVLLHIKKEDILKVLRGLHKILKPGGILHVSVKQGKGVKAVAENISQNNERLFTFFRKKEMEKLLKKAGFKIIFSKVVSDTLKRKKIKWVTTWGKRA